MNLSQGFWVFSCLLTVIKWLFHHSFISYCCAYCSFLSSSWIWILICQSKLEQYARPAWWHTKIDDNDFDINNNSFFLIFTTLGSLRIICIKTFHRLSRKNWKVWKGLRGSCQDLDVLFRWKETTHLKQHHQKELFLFSLLFGFLLKVVVFSDIIAAKSSKHKNELRYVNLSSQSFPVKYSD